MFDTCLFGTTSAVSLNKRLYENISDSPQPGQRRINCGLRYLLPEASQQANEKASLFDCQRWLSWAFFSPLAEAKGPTRGFAIFTA